MYSSIAAEDKSSGQLVGSFQAAQDFYLNAAAFEAIDYLADAPG